MSLFYIYSYVYRSFRSCGYRRATFSLDGNIAIQRRTLYFYTLGLLFFLYSSFYYSCFFKFEEPSGLVYTCVSTGPFLKEAAAHGVRSFYTYAFRTIQDPSNSKRNRQKLVLGLKSSFQWPNMLYTYIYMEYKNYS